MIARTTSTGIAFALATFVVLTVSLFVSVPVSAQVAGATLQGTVTDASGAAVPNANVSITDTGTGITRVTTTDSAGVYSVPNLVVGIYDVSVSAAGFSTQVQSGIETTVGAVRVQNFSLQLGQLTQRVNVTAEAEQVQLATSTISGEVDSTTMRELPLNGRDWSALALLQAGVLSVRTQAPTTGLGDRSGRGFGNQLTDAGHRPQENSYRIDGINVNDMSNSSPGSVLGAQLGVDAIQEFSVLIANYTAEYGRTSGAVINAVLKSGSNSFHGDAFGFLRDKNLDARNFFDPPAIPPFHRNQFGGSLGGPIKKDRTFFFANYEGIRQGRSLSEINVVPSMAARNGILCSLCATPDILKDDPVSINDPNGVDPATGIDALVFPFLALYPVPAGSFGNGDVGNVITTPLQPYTENYVSVRVDHTFSEKDNLSAVYFFDRSVENTPDSLLLTTSKLQSSRQMVGLEETHTFSPTFVNAARFGFSRSAELDNVGGQILNPLAGDPSLGIGDGLGAPEISISGGLTTMLGGLQHGTNRLSNSYQAYDDAFLVRGTHTIKFGAAIERIQERELGLTTQNGLFTFSASSANSGLKNFLANIPNSAQIGDRAVAIPVDIRMLFFGVYVQDDWHLRPNLTVNIGLRYEPTTNPIETHGGFFVIQDLYGGPRVNVQHPNQANPTLRNFEPRIGFAWDPFHDGKTSVRGGFGVFDVLPGPWYLLANQRNAYPFSCTLSTSLLSDPYSFPVDAANLLLGNSCNVSKTGAFAPEQNPKNAYAMNWNLNVQRQITPTLMATVGYVGSRTVHLAITSKNIDIVPPITSGSDYWPVTGGKIINSNANSIEPVFWVGSSDYEGLVAQVTKNMSHGLQAQASFTWGKCLSDGGESSSYANEYLNSLATPNLFVKSAIDGRCDFDVTRNFVANYVWQVPSPKVGGALGEHILGGWQLGGILTVSTGTPTTLVIAGDPLGTINNPNSDYPDRVPGCDPVNHNFKHDPSGLLAYINLSCFTPPVAPASIASDPTKCKPYPNAVTVSGAPIPNTCQQLFGDAGRNTVKGPGLANVDFSIFKNNYIPRISETFNVQFRAEFFNILNHSNFLVPNANAGNNQIMNANGTFLPAEVGGTTGGVINSTGNNTSRQIQFGLKIIW
ncbi:MAG: TonB-dependent receptor [Candidatus Acidiferrales bacterium]